MAKVTWKDVSLSDKELVATMYGQGLSVEEFAQTWGMNADSLERQIRDYIYYRRIFIGGKANQIELPESPSRQLLDFEVLYGDDWIIISDIEIPDHSVKMLELALLTAMKRGIKKLIIAGDLIATDQDALTAYIRTWRDGRESSYEETVQLTRNVLQEFSRWFDEIYIIEGNHDDRISRATRGEVHLGMFFHGLDVRYSRYSYLYFENHRGLTKVVHPSNFSSDPVKLGQEFYDVEQGPRFDSMRPSTTLEKCHFVVAHCHRQQSGHSKDGAYEVHTLGTMRDRTRTRYVSKGQSKHRQWDSGFLVVQGGYFTPMSLIGTNWHTELGDLYQDSPLAIEE